jgi:hypothetical protein
VQHQNLRTDNDLFIRKNDNYGFCSKPQNLNVLPIYQHYQPTKEEILAQHSDKAYKMIKLIGERNDIDLSEYFGAAEQVYFLGYGFHDDNNEVLGLTKHGCVGVENIYFTNFGDSKAILRKVLRLFSSYKKNNVFDRRALDYRLFQSNKDVYGALQYDFPF